jgi:hypothetical protein
LFIIVDDFGQPSRVLDADRFLRDALFSEAALDPEVYWHRPVIVTDMNVELTRIACSESFQMG